MTLDQDQAVQAASAYATSTLGFELDLAAATPLGEEWVIEPKPVSPDMPFLLVGADGEVTASMMPPEGFE